MKKLSSSKFGHYGFAVCLGILLWFGLAAFLLSFSTSSVMNGIDFMWQLVGFSFILATLVYSTNPQSIPARQRKKLPKLGIAFILSGILVIIGYGISLVAAQAGQSILQEILKWMGAITLFVATFCLSGGMTMMMLGFMDEN